MLKGWEFFTTGDAEFVVWGMALRQYIAPTLSPEGEGEGVARSYSRVAGGHR